MWHSNRKHGNLFEKHPKLDLGIHYSLPTATEIPGPPPSLELEEDEEARSRYVLGAGQRDAIRQGVVNDYDQNESILRKRDRLPERIEQALVDAALLYSSAYASTESWEEGLVERKETRSKLEEAHLLMREGMGLEEALSKAEEQEIEYYESQFDSPMDLWEDVIDVPLFYQYVRDDVFHGSSLSREAEFGFELGSFLRLLRPDQEDQLVGIDLIYGFILAFLGQSKDGVFSDEERLLDQLFDEIQNRHAERKRDAKRMPTPSEISEAGKLWDENTEQGVIEAGFTPHPVILKEVSYHQPTTSDDGDLHRKTAKLWASRIGDATPLVEVDVLAQGISGDLEVINSHGAKGIESTEPVLETMWEVESSWVSSEKIGGELGEDIGSVTAVLNRVSSEDDYDTLTAEPLVDKARGERGMEWSFTAYGEVLANTAIERDSEVEWIYRCAIGPEELTLKERRILMEALDSLGMIHG